MPNAYPELPRLPYQATSVSMLAVTASLAMLSFPVEVKRCAYVVFRNESANGHSGINNNYVGAQADGGRWPEALTPLFSGTVEKIENGTGRLRLFLAFDDVGDCLAFLCNRLQARGLYVGGTVRSSRLTMDVRTPTDLAIAYTIEWVTGEPNARPSPEALSGFLSMFNQAVGLFPG